MIIWIDGTYGVGKTTVAYEVQRQLMNCKTRLLDSDEIFENIGDEIIEDMIQNGGGTMPQNNLFFLSLFKEKIEDCLNEDTVCIVSMASTTAECLDMIWKYLSQDSKIFNHFILEADKETIIGRIEADSERKQKDFAIHELDVNNVFLKKIFNNAIIIDTSNKSVEKIAKEIVENVMLKNVFNKGEVSC